MWSNFLPLIKRLILALIMYRTYPQLPWKDDGMFGGTVNLKGYTCCPTESFVLSETRCERDYNEETERKGETASTACSESVARWLVRVVALIRSSGGDIVFKNVRVSGVRLILCQMYKSHHRLLIIIFSVKTVVSNWKFEVSCVAWRATINNNKL